MIHGCFEKFKFGCSVLGLAKWLDGGFLLASFLNFLPR
jgi:hypothetical protein